MAGRPGVTYEQVAAAADALKAQGKNPTIEAVRLYLGGGAVPKGSPNTVHKLLGDWRNARPTTAAAPIEMPVAIHAAIVQEIQRAVTEARQNLEVELAEARNTADALAEAGEVLETERDTLQERIAEVEADNQQLLGQIEVMRQDLDSSKADAAAQIAEIRQQATLQIQEAREQAQREREAGETARQSLARAELRLEGLPNLEKRLAEFQAALDAERTHRTDAERRAAVADAQATNAGKLAEDLKQRLTAAETRETSARVDRDQVRDRLTDALAQLARCEASKSAKVEKIPGTGGGKAATVPTKPSK